MSTRRQRAASRANAQKSTGRFNALKHGIDAKQQVTFSESAEDLAELAAEYHELHCPANADERFLVDSMINYEWRLRRLRGVEAKLWSAENSLPAFDRLNRIINSCERHFHRARKELQIAQAARAGCETDAQTGPQPEESTPTSASPASFRTNPEMPGPQQTVHPPVQRIVPQEMAANGAVPSPSSRDFEQI